MKLLFAGSADFAVPTLEELAARHQVATVVAPPDRPAGRGMALTPTPVAAAARRLGLTLLQPQRINSPAVVEQLRALGAEVGVLVAYGQLLRRPVLDAPQAGWINLHASLLPRWRGASPVAAAILAGDAETGVSVMAMGEGLDDGPVYATAAEPILAADDAPALTARLAQRGAPLVLEVLEEMSAGRAPTHPQAAEEATYAPRLTRDDARWDWTGAAADLDRRVRAQRPWPGVHAPLGGVEVGLVEGRPVESAGGLPGRVLEVGREGVVVACGQGAYLLTQVRPAGRPTMEAAGFARGRGLDRLG